MSFLDLNADDLWVLAMSALAGLSCALVGSFLVLRKMSMLGDALSHSVLLGLVGTYLLFGSKQPILLFAGAVTVALLTSWLTGMFHRFGQVQEDASIGVTFTWLFAMGVILLSKYAKDIDLDQDCVLYGELLLAPFDRLYLFGEDIGPRSFWSLLTVFLGNLVALLFGYRALKIICFDRTFAKTIGLNIPRWENLFLLLVAVTVVACFEAAGAILVLGFLVIPSNTAFLFARSVVALLLWSCFFSLLASFGGFWLAREMDASLAASIGIVSGILLLSVLSLRLMTNALVRSVKVSRETQNASESLSQKTG